MSIAGTALSLLNFSSEIVYKYQIVFFPKPETYNLLKLLILKGFKKYYDLNIDKMPSLFRLRYILIFLYQKRNTIPTHPFIEQFFSHLFIDEALDQVPPILVRINNKIYILSAPTKIITFLSPVFEKEVPYLFTKLREPLAQPGFLWADSIRRLTQYNGQDSLLLPQIPNTQEDNLIEQFSDFYNILMEAFCDFTFSIEQRSSKQELYAYLTTMQDFLNITQK